MVDGLSQVPMLLFAAIALVTVLGAPRRDVNSAFLWRIAILTLATMTAYTAPNAYVFFTAWLVTALASTSPLRNQLSQIKIFPFHRVAASEFDRDPLLLSALSANAQLGLFFVLRWGIESEYMPWIGGLALFTTLYTAILGVAEREPRKLLGLIMVSQSAALIAGVSALTHEGIAGALLQWIVLSLSSTILLVVYRGVEARVTIAFGENRYLGLGKSMPRLAVFFAIAGLAIVGLPGTLGFPGEDLLLHGVLAKYSWWGAALPVSIAINAYHAFRLFARLFLGKDQLTHGTAVDALPRERWALSACLIVLVWGGLLPSQFVAMQAPAAGALVKRGGAPQIIHP